MFYQCVIYNSSVYFVLYSIKLPLYMFWKCLYICSGYALFIASDSSVYFVLLTVEVAVVVRYL